MLYSLSPSATVFIRTDRHSPLRHSRLKCTLICNVYQDQKFDESRLGIKGNSLLLTKYMSVGIVSEALGHELLGSLKPLLLCAFSKTRSIEVVTNNQVRGLLNRYPGKLKTFQSHRASCCTGIDMPHTQRILTAEIYTSPVRCAQRGLLLCGLYLRAHA